MRKRIGRAGRALLAWCSIAAVGLPLAAEPAGRSAPREPEQPGRSMLELAASYSRLAEIRAELDWLGDAVTFPYLLSARANGLMLEVSGQVPTEAVRRRALELARGHSALCVRDLLTVNPAAAVVPLFPRIDVLQREAVDVLSAAMPQLAAGFLVRAQGDGQVTVQGTVPSFEEKLTVSRRLRRVPTCNRVVNELVVTPVELAGKRYLRVTSDGRHLVPVEAPAPRPSPVVTAGPPRVLLGPPIAAVPESIAPGDSLIRVRRSESFCQPEQPSGLPRVALLPPVPIDLTAALSGRPIQGSLATRTGERSPSGLVVVSHEEGPAIGPGQFPLGREEDRPAVADLQPESAPRSNRTAPRRQKPTPVAPNWKPLQECPAPPRSLPPVTTASPALENSIYLPAPTRAAEPPAQVEAELLGMPRLESEVTAAPTTPPPGASEPPAVAQAVPPPAPARIPPLPPRPMVLVNPAALLPASLLREMLGREVIAPPTATASHGGNGAEAHAVAESSQAGVPTAREPGPCAISTASDMPTSDPTRPQPTSPLSGTLPETRNSRVVPARWYGWGVASPRAVIAPAPQPAAPSPIPSSLPPTSEPPSISSSPPAPKPQARRTTGSASPDSGRYGPNIFTAIRQRTRSAPDGAPAAR